MVKLFVSGFPLEITEMELARMFGPHGDISTIKIVRDKQTRKCKGYAFIEMISNEAANNAVAALNGMEMVGRELTVKVTEDKPVAPATNYRKPFVDTPRSYSSQTRPPVSDCPKRPRRPMA